MNSTSDQGSSVNKNWYLNLFLCLLYLVLLAMLPNFILMIYHIEEEHQYRVHDLQLDAIRVSEQCASSVAQIVESTRQTLLSLACVKSVRSMDASEANILLADVLTNSTNYGNLGVVRPDGINVAGGLPQTNVNSSTQPWFQRLQSSHSFTIGEYQIGKITGKPGINFALPLPNQPTNGPISSIYAALKLEILQACLSKVRLPPDGVLNIIDRNGTVLARNPNPHEWIGKSSKAWPVFKKEQLPGQNAFVETPGIDNVVRLYHFTEVPNSDQSIYVGVAYSKALLNAEVLKKTIIASTWLCLASIGALFLGYIAAKHWLLRPVKLLRDVLHELASGNLSARIDTKSRVKEFRELADDFDVMAAKLEEYLRQIQDNEIKFRAVTMSAQDAIILLDTEGKIAFWNNAAEKMFGYNSSEAVGMEAHFYLAPARFYDAHRKGFEIFKTTGQGAAVGQTLEMAALRKGGAEFPIELSVSAVMLHGRWNAIGIVRDITSRKRAEAELHRHREHLEELVQSRTDELKHSVETLSREQRLLSELNQLKHQLFGCKPLHEKLQLICEGIVSIFTADFVRVWLIRDADLCNGCPHAAVQQGPTACRERSHCLHLVASAGRYTHLDGEHRRIPLGFYKIGIIAAGVEDRVFTNNVLSDPLIQDHSWARSLGLTSFAGFRLLSEQGQVAGVLGLFSRHSIDPLELNLLEDVVNLTSQVLIECMARQAMQDSEEVARTLLDAIPASAMLIDTNYNTLAANETVAKRLNITVKHMIGKCVFDMVPPEVATRRKPFVEKALGTGELVRFEDVRLGRIIDNLIAPVRDTKGRITRLAIVGFDITEHAALKLI